MSDDENRKSDNKDEEEHAGGFRFRHAFLIIAVLLLLLSIFSHNPGDLAVLDGGSDMPLQNWIGPTGAYISRTLL